MIITIQNSEGDVVSATISDDSDIHEVAEKLRGLLITYGYHCDNVNEILPTEE